MYRTMAFVLLLTYGCGGRDAKKRLDESVNSMTLDPPPGEYTYKPWVRIKNSEDKMGSGILGIKAPGDHEFKEADFCPSGMFDADLLDYCIEVKESGRFEYFLYNSDVESDIKSVDYVVSLNTNPLSLQTTDTREEAEQSDLSEVETFCHISSEDASQTRHEVIVQFGYESEDSEDYGGYLGFSFNVNAPDQAIIINQYSEDFSAGIDFKPAEKDVPPSFAFEDYVIQKSHSLDNGTESDAACLVVVKDYT